VNKVAVTCEHCRTATVRRVSDSPRGIEAWRCDTCGDYKRWCPECNQGWIRRYRDPIIERDIFSCDECEAAWPFAQSIGVPGDSRRMVLRHGAEGELPRLELVRETTTPTTVRIRFHRGDAREIVAPVAVIGDRSPVRAWLVQEHGAVFEKVVTRQRSIPSRTPAQTSQANPESGPWRHVISVRTDVRRNNGLRVSNDLSDTLFYAITQWAPREIVVLPLTWRDPATVVMNTIMALWIMAYYSNLMFPGPWPDPEFILASLDATDEYIDAIGPAGANFYAWLAPIFDRDAVSFFGPKPVLDREKVVFDWRE
jgi:hypothetical protein